jgi:hypothetical protein
MHPPVLLRPALVFVLSVAAFTAGAVSATLMTSREAHAQTLSSTIQVPHDGLTFRSAEGHAIARLSYDYEARGGVFEILDDRGDVVASVGQRGRTGIVPAARSRAEWSLDVVPDPWTPERAPDATQYPPSGL